MIRTRLSVGVLALASAATLLAPLAGCKTTTEERRMEARHAAQSFRDALRTMPDQIDSTMNSLYEVTGGATRDRNASYREFGEQLSALQADANHVASHAQDARANADRYFTQWARDAVASEPAKREQMQEAMSGRTRNYDTALSYLDSARDRYRTLVANLNDIKRTLDGNLSAYSSNEMRNMVGAAQLKSVELKNYIARLTEQIDSTLATR